MIKKLIIIIILMIITPIILTLNANAWTQFNDGGVYDIDYIIDDDVWVDYNKLGMETTVNFLKGGGIADYSHKLQCYENSIININWGYIYDFNAYNESQINMTSGDIERRLTLYDDSQVNMSNGYMRSLVLYNNSQANVSGGNISSISLYGNNQLDASGGNIKNIRLAYNSQANISHISANKLNMDDHSQINLRNSGIDQINLTDYNLCNIFDSSINSIMVGGWSRLNIYNGNINTLSSQGESQINMYSGNIENNIAIDYGSTLTLFGYDFAIDGEDTEYGKIFSILGESYSEDPNRVLSGTWLSGDTFEFDFRIGESFGGSSKIVLAPPAVPIPATAWLLGSGLLGLIGWTRKKK